MKNFQNNSISLLTQKIDKCTKLQHYLIALILTLSVASCSVEEEGLSTEVLTSESSSDQTAAQRFPSLANVFKMESTWGNGTSEIEYWVSQTKAFFYVNNYNKLIMKCQGIQDARTEVKEIGNHSIWDSHTLYYKGSIVGLDGTDHELTIGQVHNHENGSNTETTVQRPLIRVYILNGRMSAKLARTPYGETDDLDEDDYGTQTGPLYSNGQNYEIRMKIVGNRTVQILMKNASTGDSNTRTFWVPTTWSSHYDAFYFKAGLYNDGGNSTVTWNRITNFATW